MCTWREVRNFASQTFRLTQGAVFINFDSGSGSELETKTQNPARFDSVTAVP